MSNIKDYTKVIIIALLSAMATQTAGRIFIKSDIIDNAVTRKELRLVKDEAKKDTETVKRESMEYTDKKIIEYDVSHTKLHSEQKIQLTQIQTDLTIIKEHLIND